jgi:tetratricopeptide (TPR) repeat protein
METPLDNLVKDAKQSNTIQSYIKLYHHYKSSKKYFSAQQTLERCLENVKLDPMPYTSDKALMQCNTMLYKSLSDGAGIYTSDSFSTTLQDIIKLMPDLKPVPRVYNPDAYVVYSLLGDITLLIKQPQDAMQYFYLGYINYTDTSNLNQKILANIIYSGLIECFISLMLQSLYEKQYKLTNAWKEHTNWLISHVKSSKEYSNTSEKLELMIGNYYFILYSWYGNPGDFEVCESHVSNIENTELKFIMAYYRDKVLAKGYIKDLILNNPGISIYWTWLSFVEEDYTRKHNAVTKALQIDKKNWVGWVCLSIIQASVGDFMNSAKTWKVAHHLNHQDSKLWLVSAFLYKEAKMVQKSIQSFKLSCDLEPSMWMTIEHYLANS